MPVSHTTYERPDGVDLLVVSTACHTAINRSIYRRFVDAGWSVVLVVPKELPFNAVPVAAELPNLDDPPIEFLELQGRHARLYRFLGLRKTLDRHRPRIVLLDNDPISLSALEVGLWCRGNGTYLVCLTCENMSLGVTAAMHRRGIRGMPVALLKRAGLAIARRLVHGLFTINEEGTAVFRAERFRNVVRIPLGFDRRYFRVDGEARTRLRNQIGLGGFVIGYFGRVTYEKGVHVLLDALESITDEEWTLLIDRFEAYRSMYGDAIRRRLQAPILRDRVVFVDPLHVEMGAYINAVDLVVVPSISTPNWIEQYGRIAAEALACGQRVIAARSGALPMLLGGHGLLFDEGDADELAKLLKREISSKEPAAKRESAQVVSAYAHENLSVDRQMTVMIEMFRAL